MGYDIHLKYGGGVVPDAGVARAFAAIVPVCDYESRSQAGMSFRMLIDCVTRDRGWWGRCYITSGKTLAPCAGEARAR